MDKSTALRTVTAHLQTQRLQARARRFQEFAEPVFVEIKSRWEGQGASFFSGGTCELFSVATALTAYAQTDIPGEYQYINCLMLDHDGNESVLSALDATEWQIRQTYRLESDVPLDWVFQPTSNIVENPLGNDLDAIRTLDDVLHPTSRRIGTIRGNLYPAGAHQFASLEPFPLEFSLYELLRPRVTYTSTKPELPDLLWRNAGAHITGHDDDFYQDSAFYIGPSSTSLSGPAVSSFPTHPQQEQTPRPRNRLMLGYKHATTLPGPSSQPSYPEHAHSSQRTPQPYYFQSWN